MHTCLGGEPRVGSLRGRFDSGPKALHFFLDVKGAGFGFRQSAMHRNLLMTDLVKLV